ncbi:hypothetical protein GCM10009559_75330 [Pseudonocardia zijingensis]|uniref:Antitoxin protein of toxin-antitoxin system n=1 Tax=Pseudonocardia zijingensis TaxID=153376 RepID=A0ABP3YY37_9PSEU
MDRDHGTVAHEPRSDGPIENRRAGQDEAEGGLRDAATQLAHARSAHEAGFRGTRPGDTASIEDAIRMGRDHRGVA